jgi:hypothetical protein
MAAAKNVGKKVSPRKGTKSGVKHLQSKAPIKNPSKWGPRG